MNEVFRPVLGYEGIYSISNLGRVYSHSRISSGGSRLKGKYRTLSLSRSGYLTVSLCKKGVQTSTGVHRLVAEVFVPGHGVHLTVHHIDEDKTNNHPSNLEWCTQQENNDYSKSKYYNITHPNGKTETIQNLNRFCIIHGLHSSALNLVVRGKAKHHKGFIGEVL